MNDPFAHEYPRPAPEAWRYTRADFARALAIRQRRLGAGEVDAWRRINGFTRYEVSRLGFVRNRDTGRVLKPFAHCQASPYLRVTLRKASGPNAGKPFHRYAHRLVALYHVPGRSRERSEAHHTLDPVTLRPNLWRISADVLAWTTPEENRLCRGEPLADGTTGPGRLLASVREEAERIRAADRAELESRYAGYPTTAPF